VYAASITRNPDNPANKHIEDFTEYAKEYEVELRSLIKVQPYIPPGLHGTPTSTSILS